jgi:hypothetical protein
MNPPPPETPTPSTLGAVDLDPWIPKPSTRDIVDHLVQEINAAKAIAEEITCVQGLLDGMMEGTQVFEQGVVERVQRELEAKSRRVEELEELLGMEREEKRALEERIRIMEDERAAKLEIVVQDEEEDNDKEKEEAVETSTETMVEQPPSPVKSLALPETNTPTTQQGIVTPPASPSTAPSSPLQDSSTRSISPISLPSTESSSHTDTSHLLEKIAHLESQLSSATKQIEQLKQQTGPVLGAVSAAIAASSVDFPFTFSAPTSSPSRTPKSPRSRRNGSMRRKQANGTSSAVVVSAGGISVEGIEEVDSPEKGAGTNKELIEGLCAAVGVVVLGWMGMWLVNHLVERGDRVVK